MFASWVPERHAVKIAKMAVSAPTMFISAGGSSLSRLRLASASSLRACTPSRTSGTSASLSAAPVTSTIGRSPSVTILSPPPLWQMYGEEKSGRIFTVISGSTYCRVPMR